MLYMTIWGDRTGALWMRLAMGRFDYEASTLDAYLIGRMRAALEHDAPRLTFETYGLPAIRIDDTDHRFRRLLDIHAQAAWRRALGPFGPVPQLAEHISG